MNPRTAFICINGIFTSPGDADGWTDRAVTWLHLNHSDGRAEKFEYWTDILFRQLRQRERADQIAKKVGYYRRHGFRVVLVGHSNGCDLTARVISVVGQEIDTAHLFAPATDGTMFDDALRDGLIRRIHIYGSKKDRALQFARRTRPIIGWTGMGFGYLGLHGHEFAAQHPGTVVDHSNHQYDHGTWFTRGAIFESTMELLLANDREDVKLLPV